MHYLPKHKNPREKKTTTSLLWHRLHSEKPRSALFNPIERVANVILDEHQRKAEIYVLAGSSTAALRPLQVHFYKNTRTRRGNSDVKEPALHLALGNGASRQRSSRPPPRCFDGTNWQSYIVYKVSLDASKNVYEL